jgi:hypothetical protein
VAPECHGSNCSAGIRLFSAGLIGDNSKATTLQMARPPYVQINRPVTSITRGSISHAVDPVDGRFFQRGKARQISPRSSLLLWFKRNQAPGSKESGKQVQSSMSWVGLCVLNNAETDFLGFSNLANLGFHPLKGNRLGEMDFQERKLCTVSNDHEDVGLRCLSNHQAFAQHPVHQLKRQSVVRAPTSILFQPAS